MKYDSRFVNKSIKWKETTNKNIEKEWIRIAMDSDPETLQLAVENAKSIFQDYDNILEMLQVAPEVFKYVPDINLNKPHLLKALKLDITLSATFFLFKSDFGVLQDKDIQLLQQVVQTPKEIKSFLETHSYFFYRYLTPEIQNKFASEILNQAMEYKGTLYISLEEFNFQEFNQDFWTLANTTQVLSMSNFGEDRTPMSFFNFLLEKIGHNENAIQEVIVNATEKNKKLLYKTLSNDFKMNEEITYALLKDNKHNYFLLPKELQKNETIISIVTTMDEYDVVDLKDIPRENIFCIADSDFIVSCIKKMPDLLKSKNLPSHWQTNEHVLIKTVQFEKYFCKESLKVLANILKDYDKCVQIVQNNFNYYERLPSNQKNKYGMALTFIHSVVKQQGHIPTEMKKLNKAFFDNEDFCAMAFKIDMRVSEMFPSAHWENSSFKIKFFKVFNEMYNNPNNNHLKSHLLTFVPKKIKSEMMQAGVVFGQMNPFWFEKNELSKDLLENPQAKIPKL